MEILFARAGTCSSLPWQISVLKRVNARSLPPQLRKPCLVKKQPCLWQILLASHASQHVAVELSHPEAGR